MAPVFQKGVNDFKTWCEQNNRMDLYQEWNSEKNVGISPDSVARGCNKKFWWICHKCGTEWQATMLNRTRGSGCPHCGKLLSVHNTNKTKIKQSGSLLDVYPLIAEEWDYEKNVDLLPSDFTYKSGKSVWWKCKNGHEWKAKISNRANGTKCPYCSGKLVIKGENDLATLKPELVNEWNYEKNAPLTPSDVMPGSTKKYWWKCRKGHEWRADLNHRSSGRGCPYCYGKSTSMPEQAIAYYLERVTEVKQREKLFGKECDVYLPAYNIGIEYDGGFHHINKREADKNKEKLFIDKGITFFRIVGEADKDEIINNHLFCTDDSLGKNFDSTLRALCELIAKKTNNNAFAQIEIDTRKDILKIRERIDLYEKKNSLAVKYPEIAKEWNYDKNGKLGPDMVLSGSSLRVWWKCSNGHEWENSICNRTSQNQKCPYCRGHRVIPGINDLCSCNRLLAKEWNYDKNGELKPTDVTLGSDKIVWWKCSKCNNEWQARINERNRGTKCPICYREYLSKNRRNMSISVKGSLSETSPDIAKEWHPTKNTELSPNEVSSGSHDRVWWKCSKCGNEWQVGIRYRCKGKGRCPKCKGKE